ncbi:MAG: PD-(D/E)XK nuclease family protein [Tannerella sp.]|jgi:hypothetical protein|nr:PD-(D/E)XK nuclease family protein [Tannerella sp.]
MQSEETIKNLLHQVSTLNKHYSELARLSGEDFNIFKVINLTTDEVRIHSAFIAELLNPKGSHGQGTIFLELFVKQKHLNCDFLDIANAKVTAEENIGKKTETEGGRIDILITDNNTCIAIENKIYAGDQENQLVRYANYCKKYNPSQLLYLTLEGKDASDDSAQDKNGDTAKYIRISYEDDIIKWLETCRKESVTFPILREGITHYINLIKLLTNQSTNKAMKEEIVKLLLSPENFEAAGKIEVSLKEARTQIQLNFWKKLKNRFIEKGYKIQTTIEGRNITEDQIRNFYHKNKKINPVLAIEFAKKDNMSFVWFSLIDGKFSSGFLIDYDGDRKENSEEYKKCIDIVSKMDKQYNPPNRFWLGWKYSNPQLDFRAFDSETCKLLNPQNMEDVVNKIADDAIANIEEFKKRFGSI